MGNPRAVWYMTMAGFAVYQLATGDIGGVIVVMLVAWLLAGLI